jgi:hypothetical protein
MYRGKILVFVAVILEDGSQLQPQEHLFDNISIQDESNKTHRLASTEADHAEPPNGILAFVVQMRSWIRGKD